MKATIQRKSFLSAMKVARDFLDQKGTMPALAQVMISSSLEDGSLFVSATDLECYFRGRVEGDATAGGELALSGRRVFDLLSVGDAEEVVVESAGDAARLKVGGTSYKLPTFDTRAIPQCPLFEAPKSLKEKAEGFDEDAPGVLFAAKVLRELLDATLPFISPDEARYNLAGVFVSSPSVGIARFVATDGHRLSLVERAVPEFSLEGNMLIPRKALLSIRKLLTGDEIVRVAATKDMVKFSVGEHELTSRLIEGTFPDYNGVIPKALATEMQVHVGSWKNALLRVAVIGDERFKSVRLEFKKNALTLSSKEGSGGEASAEIPTSQASEKDIEFGINSAYAISALEIFDEEAAVSVGLNDGTSPMVLKANDIVHVVMPLRL